MGKNNSTGSVVKKGNKPVSQKAQLEQIRKTNIMVLAIGIVLVVVSFAMSMPRKITDLSLFTKKMQVYR